jgi:S1-C subfamily serine protease
MNRAALRYRVVSRVDSRLDVKGSNLDSVHYTLRIDPIKVEGGMERGYLGITIEAGSTTSWGNGTKSTEVRIKSVFANGPAKLANVTPGLAINTINNQPVTSVSQFQSAASRYLPGEKVTLQCWDNNTGRQRTFTIKLVARDALQRQ